MTPAAHAQHVMKLKAKEQIPDGYATRIVGPFLVIGDESPARVEHHAQTVEWTVDHLKKEFKMREPPHVIDVWLLGSRDSYVDNAMRLFGMPPRSPYGYFVAQQQALIMNIGTGGGTLVHELVHPFIAASFPSAPAWFNEGLASLYEAVREKDGQFWGVPNWRLVGLKRAIRAGKLPSFETMTGDSDAGFYTSNTGYAQARYLLFYLQEKGLLHRYYDQFSAGVAGRSDRLQDAGEGARRAQHGAVREAVAGVGAGAGSGLSYWVSIGSMRKGTGRKLLVATLGVGAVSYVACSSSWWPI